jgi:hypothetical protein
MQKRMMTVTYFDKEEKEDFVGYAEMGISPDFIHIGYEDGSSHLISVTNVKRIHEMPMGDLKHVS